MSRKPRGDSKLDALTPAQQVRLAEWLTIENLTYAQAKENVLAEFSITTSHSALHAFFSRFAAPWKFAQARGQADKFAELMTGKFDEATMMKVKQLAFDAVTSPRPDLDAVSALLKIVADSAKQTLAQEKLSLETRKVKLLEAKAALADQAKEISGDAALTPAEKEARIKAVFGIA